MADLDVCLKYAVGLSQDNCDCIGDTDRPEDYNRSDSGYYLDDMEIAPPLIMPKVAKDHCVSFWNMMQRARTDGIRDFVTDFLVMSKDYTSIKTTPFDGSFADNEKINNVLTGINKQYLVAKYEPIKYVRGAIWEIRDLGLITNTAGTYTLEVYKSSDLGTPLYSQDITVTTPGVLATQKPQGGSPAADVVWKLPLWEEDRKLKYYFVYDRGASAPYNMKFNCGCGSRTRQWQKHLRSWGMQTDDISTLEINSTGNNFSQGIWINGSLTCDGFDWMCREWNYKTDSFARVMARLIQLYSIRKLHSLILNSRRINAYTILAPEALQNRQAAISMMIKDPQEGNMAYLFRNIPRGVTGCWECPSKFQKRSIRV